MMPEAQQVYLVRRCLARLIDGLLLGFVLTPLWGVAIVQLEHRAASGTAWVGGRSLFALATDGWSGAGATALDESGAYWNPMALIVAITLTVAVVTATLYEWLAHALVGRTVGKAVVGVRVIRTKALTEPAQRLRPGLGQAALRAGVTILLPGAGWVLLVVATIALNPVVVLLGVALVLSGWVDVAWLLFRRDGRRLCLHDNLGGTVVVSANYGDQLRRATQAGRQAVTHGRVVVERWQHSETAQRAMERGRATTERIRHSDSAQRAVRRSQAVTERARQSGLGSMVERRIRDWRAPQPPHSPAPDEAQMQQRWPEEPGESAEEPISR